MRDYHCYSYLPSENQMSLLINSNGMSVCVDWFYEVRELHSLYIYICIFYVIIS